MKVVLTEGEAASLLNYLELSFIQYVKDNPDIDSMLWMDNMLTIWRKCGGRKQYADGGEGK
jgi:hypothetical protein